jgi:hypothetical protein
MISVICQARKCLLEDPVSDRRQKTWRAERAEHKVLERQTVNYPRSSPRPWEAGNLASAFNTGFVPVTPLGRVAGQRVCTYLS